MKIIGLKEREPGTEEWRFHRFNDAGEMEQMMQVRGISIGKDVQIAPYAMIGDNVTIADRVTLGEECTVDDGCVIGEGTRIGDRTAVGLHCNVGKGVVIDDDAFIDDRCTLADGVSVGHDTEVGRETKAAEGVVLDENSFVDDRTVLGKDVHVFKGAYIGKDNVIGSGCRIHEDARVCSHILLGRDVTVWPDQRIPSFSTVTVSTAERSHAKIDTSHRPAMEMKFDELSVKQDPDGFYMLKGKYEGEWLPRTRLDGKDVEAYLDGRMSLRSLGNKYLVDDVYAQADRRMAMAR